jgi:hypothetical protein
MRERSVVHAMREVMTGGRTAGGRRGAGLGRKASAKRGYADSVVGTLPESPL